MFLNTNTTNSKYNKYNKVKIKENKIPTWDVFRDTSQTQNTNVSNITINGLNDLIIFTIHMYWVSSMWMVVSTFPIIFKIVWQKGEREERILSYPIQSAKYYVSGQF